MAKMPSGRTDNWLYSNESHLVSKRNRLDRQLSGILRKANKQKQTDKYTCIQIYMFVCMIVSVHKQRTDTFIHISEA